MMKLKNGPLPLLKQKVKKRNLLSLSKANSILFQLLQITDMAKNSVKKIRSQGLFYHKGHKEMKLIRNL